MILLTLMHLFNFILANSNFYSPMGSQQSLRQNIKKLTKGKLDFSSKSLPFDKNELSDTTPKNYSKYDFVVIGAGTAGSTIASRLSEMKNITVLLIEAGGKEYSIIDIPGMAIPLQYSNDINWKYETESSDRYCLGLENHKCNWPRGKVMGGSSAINYMLATRGNQRDYDQWANATGDESWSFRNMLKYFQKMEHFYERNVPADSAFHGTNGPLHISGPQQKSKLTDAFIQAGKELHYPEVDYNGLEQRGFSYHQSAIYEGERWSNNRAYLRLAKGRKNLFVTQHSHVHKILINKHTKSAYGVRYSKNGKVYEVSAQKEIILCAGSVNSPQILMLSGIGPSKHLRDMNIDVIKDAAVGENLIDHIGYTGIAFKANDFTDSNNLSLVDPKNPALKNYLKSRTGPLALGLNSGGIAFINVDDANKSYPNLELLFNLFSSLKDPLFATTFGVNKEYQKQLFTNEANGNSWTIWPIVIKPYSRGKILLSSNNPFDKLKIYPNYLEDSRDVQVLVKGIRMVIKLSQTKAFQEQGSKMYEVPLPCDNHKEDSDEYWECAARTYTGTIYHPVGTCKMGREDDNSSVVNSQLKVIGVKGLRIVDASVMPDIICGHTNIPVTAIAEKAYDIIKKDYDF
ncbi:glucose dehydrogenase [FAD, quinone]-like [Phymastichus coffea]|uniref:glucose dehydrogenase [FAD, quinone]-like n=1 Tax=Phymastichus coffea TaxID=108790 RepID=UPI00273CE7BD|nr:glucose dehydrogenase [FAD, quinone]-like [Phymastichus coffea]